MRNFPPPFPCSVVALAKVDGAVDQLSVAEGARLLRARGHHHRLVSRGVAIEVDASQDNFVVHDCSLSGIGLLLLLCRLTCIRRVASQLIIDAPQVAAR